MRPKFRSKQKLLSVNIIVSAFFFPTALFSYCDFSACAFFCVRFFPVRFFPLRFFPRTYKNIHYYYTFLYISPIKYHEVITRSGIGTHKDPHPLPRMYVILHARAHSHSLANYRRVASPF